MKTAWARPSGLIRDVADLVAEVYEKRYGKPLKIEYAQNVPPADMHEEVDKIFALLDGQQSATKKGTEKVPFFILYSKDLSFQAAPNKAAKPQHP